MKYNLERKRKETSEKKIIKKLISEYTILESMSGVSSLLPAFFPACLYRSSAFEFSLDPEIIFEVESLESLDSFSERVLC